MNEWAKLGVCSIDEAFAFIGRQTAYHRRINILERAHPPPFVIARDLALFPGVIECGLENCQGAVGAGLAFAFVIGRLGGGP